MLFFLYFIRNKREALEKLRFFTFGQKQSFYLIHSAQKYFEKFAFKNKNKTRKLKWLYLKSKDDIRVETNIFREFIQFYSKKACFLRALLAWVHGRGLRSLLPLVLMSGFSWAQRVNDKPVKVLNLRFFAYFICK